MRLKIKHLGYSGSFTMWVSLISSFWAPSFDFWSPSVEASGLSGRVTIQKWWRPTTQQSRARYKNTTKKNKNKKILNKIMGQRKRETELALIKLSKWWLVFEVKGKNGCVDFALLGQLWPINERLWLSGFKYCVPEFRGGHWGPCFVCFGSGGLLLLRKCFDYIFCEMTEITEWLMNVVYN